MSKETKKRVKYEKPKAQELQDLTPAAGLCATGGTDGGCVPGGSAGGVEGCAVGTSASSPGCAIGEGALAGCSNGALVYGGDCTDGGNFS